MSVIIVDNFLEYPSIIREWAITKDYYSCKQFAEMYGQHTEWPGKRTQHVIDLNVEYANNVLNRVANLAASYFGLQDISIKSYFQSTIKSDGDSWVHQDNDVKVAGILYLNPNAPINSGTTLYNCTDVVKWESFMDSTEGYERLKTINRIEDKTLYESLFQPVDVIGNVFNRLVMYPGDTYHKSNDYFGESVADGRLTQVFFIN